MRYFLFALIPVVVCAVIFTARAIVKEKFREQERQGCNEIKVYVLSSKLLCMMFITMTVVLSVLVAVVDMFFDVLFVKHDLSVFILFNAVYALTLCGAVFLCIQAYRQSITVSRDTVVYLPLIGRKTTCTFADIDKIVAEDGAYRAYNGQKILFRFLQYAPERDELIALLKEHNVSFVCRQGEKVK